MYHRKLLLASAWILFSPALLAIDLIQYTKNLPIKVPDLDRSTIIGIFDSCGNASNIKDDCVIAGLERVKTEENNKTAKEMLEVYEQSQGMGDYANPECQIESHLQANRVVGHCILLMDYFAVKNLDESAAVGQYQMCLLGGMQGLTFNGNIVAQYILSQLYEERGVQNTADIWKKALLMRKDTDEYHSLMKCYK